MTALICGSMAYDTIMVFNDKFKNHILPEKVHILNVSFLVPELRREYGGCAGNIAYNLKCLGGQGAPMATVGKDFQPYAQWMQQCGVDARYIKVIDSEYTAQAYITTDMDDNQITAFHPGAMMHAHANKVSDAENISIGIIAPDGKDGMVQHAQQFADENIPFIFDPGQGLPMYNGEELLDFVDKATWVALNDYEAQLLQERIGQGLDQLAAKVKAIFVTKGGEGSEIYTTDGKIEIPVAKANGVVDPTGCGDAYRAGLLHGLMNDMDLETTARIASVLGALKIAENGSQNHQFDASSFLDRFKESYGYTVSL